MADGALVKAVTLKIEKSDASSFVSAAVPTGGASVYLEVTGVSKCEGSRQIQRLTSSCLPAGAVNLGTEWDGLHTRPQGDLE